MTIRTLCVLNQQGSSRLRLQLSTISDHEVTFVTDEFNSGDIAAICERTQPDLVFYDPAQDRGAYLLHRQQTPNSTPVIACYTSDVRYAVEAFEAGAVHYLLPTSDTVAIETALQRAARRIKGQPQRLDYRERATSEALVVRETQPHMAKVIALPLQNGIDIRPCDQIVHVHGEGSYARVIFQRDPAVIVSRSIGDCEETLQDRGFLRVHRSHLVNLMHVRRVLRGKQQRLCMSNGDEVEVSERHRDQLMEHLNIIGRKRR